MSEERAVAQARTCLEEIAKFLTGVCSAERAVNDHQRGWNDGICTAATQLLDFEDNAKAVKALADYAAVQVAAPGWSSVDERLPAVGGTYLVGAWQPITAGCKTEWFRRGQCLCRILDNGATWEGAPFNIEYWAEPLPAAPRRKPMTEYSDYATRRDERKPPDPTRALAERTAFDIVAISHVGFIERREVRTVIESALRESNARVLREAVAYCREYRGYAFCAADELETRAAQEEAQR